MLDRLIQGGRVVTPAGVGDWNIGIEGEKIGVTYTEAVVRRGMSLEDYVAVTSSNAAKLLGLHPRKGATGGRMPASHLSCSGASPKVWPGT
jgi:dihydropyrimidinase